jgi:hypothetical protein
MDHHSDEWEQVNGARDVEYGLRDVHRRTTYEHMGSSSLTPGQTMERKDFTSWIYHFFDRALEYLMGMVQIQSEFTWLRLFVRHWEEIMGESVGRAVKKHE